MVAVKSLVGSTPLAWVNVAMVTLLWVLPNLVMDADTTIGGSATAVLALALLLAVLESGELLVTEAALVRLPSSSAWTVIVAVALAPELRLPKLKVTTLPD